MASEDELRTSMDKLRDVIDNLAKEFVQRREYRSDQLRVADRIGVVADDVKEIKSELTKAADSRSADKRLFLTAFLTTLGVLVVDLYLQHQGVK